MVFPLLWQHSAIFFTAHIIAAQVWGRRRPVREKPRLPTLWVAVRYSCLCFMNNCMLFTMLYITVSSGVRKNATRMRKWRLRTLRVAFRNSCLCFMINCMLFRMLYITVNSSGVRKKATRMRKWRLPTLWVAVQYSCLWFMINCMLFRMLYNCKLWSHLVIKEQNWWLVYIS